MKKLMTVGLIFASSVSAQTLEERVENLEFKSYENYTKVSGRLEYRFDTYTREIKDTYKTLNTSTSSEDTFSKGNSAAGYQRVFLNLDISSKPSDKLSFYGKLSMAKYVNAFNTDKGTLPEDAAYNDLARGSTASSSDIFVERAFANYSFNKNLTLTFGRLPTSHGAPRHFSMNESRKGNYPILSFGGNWDGMALSYGIAAGQAVKLVYTPVSSIPFDGQLTDGLTDKDGEAVDVNVPSYALIYEMEKSNFASANNFYFTLTYYSIKDMPTFPSTGATGSNLYLTLQRTSLYTELTGIAGSHFDVYAHAVSTKTDSEGEIIQTKGGWLTDKDSDSVSGSAYGLGVRYSLAPNMKLGVEYFAGGENAFLYDSSSQDPANIYTTYGTGYHLFYSHDFEGGFKMVVGHTTKNSEYGRYVFNLIGATSEIDNTETNGYAKFIASF
ncbi:MAG: DUF3373 family protein [Bacteriovoracaceae bacterium]|jgi:opacity protein-like surface antigen|nr:DUF3373 family protein [Bacteriovoracaceae bacterium]